MPVGPYVSTAPGCLHETVVEDEAAFVRCASIELDAPVGGGMTGESHVSGGVREEMFWLRPEESEVCFSTIRSAGFHGQPPWVSQKN